jgi:Co/Zn/Cd efflux system component
MQKRRNSKGGTWCLASLILQTAFGLCKNQLHCLLEHQTRASNQTALQLCENQLHCLLEHQTRASNQTVLQLCENQLHCLLEHQTKVQTAVECVKISFILYWSIDQAALWLRC